MPPHPPPNLAEQPISNYPSPDENEQITVVHQNTNTLCRAIKSIIYKRSSDWSFQLNIRWERQGINDDIPLVRWKIFM